MYSLFSAKQQQASIECMSLSCSENIAYCISSCKVLAVDQLIISVTGISVTGMLLFSRK
jgi:hypothetical protein